MPWAGPVPARRSAPVVGWEGYKENFTSSLLGTWSVLAAFVAAFAAEAADPGRLADVFKLAITPLAVVQGLSVYVLRGGIAASDKSVQRRRRNRTAREFVVSTSSWSATFSIILIFAYLLAEKEWMSNLLGPIAAGFTVWSLLSVSRLGSMRAAIEEYRRKRRLNQIADDAVWDGRVTARSIDMLSMVGIASAIVLLAVQLGALEKFSLLIAYRMSLVLGAGYETIMLACRGSTIGKLAFKLRVHYVGHTNTMATTKGGGLGFQVAATRTAAIYVPLAMHTLLFLLPIDGALLGPAAHIFLWVYFLFPPQIHPNGRSTWDVIAETQVRRRQ